MTLLFAGRPLTAETRSLDDRQADDRVAATLRLHSEAGVPGGSAGAVAGGEGAFAPSIGQLIGGHPEPSNVAYEVEKRASRDFDGLVRFCAENGIETFAVFCCEVERVQSTIQVRDFCPAVGVAVPLGNLVQVP